MFASWTPVSSSPQSRALLSTMAEQDPLAVVVPPVLAVTVVPPAWTVPPVPRLPSKCWTCSLLRESATQRRLQHICPEPCLVSPPWCRLTDGS